MRHPRKRVPPLTSRATVFAVVPHFGTRPDSDDWLRGCLESIAAQTRPPEGVIVVDDASPWPPDGVVAGIPNVTLLRNAGNTGPFAILDELFARLRADALMLHDSDDWSASERLEMLLRAAERAGAHMAGCQAERVFEDVVPDGAEPRVPLDPRAALLESPTLHAVLLPTCVVSIELVRQLGGMASGFPFGADSEFVRRAVLGADVVNVPDVLYYRRIHSHSLTRRPETGMGSPARSALQRVLQDRAREMTSVYQRGEPIDLGPIARGEPARLTHVLGPPPPWMPA